MAQTEGEWGFVAMEEIIAKMDVTHCFTTKVSWSNRSYPTQQTHHTCGKLNL